MDLSVFVLCYVFFIAQVSGDSNAANQSLYCNGRWCVQNEEYCDKIQTKCVTCQYTQHNCTPHLDCLSYCIEKGIDQVLQESHGIIPEENSNSSRALLLFIIVLVFFIVSLCVNIVFGILLFRQRQATNQTETRIAVTGVDDQKTQFHEEVRANVDQETIFNEMVRDEDDEETPFNKGSSDDDNTDVKTLHIIAQEVGSESNEKEHLENLD
ncbi:hypothetical protein CHS0354_042979 [Potamilus streckersoni]|uniref:Uncharacterized protein n=1 Tax=Potamilus streckersoni TaxID=2493646 RepID=A0AAE0W6R4_9BIVA|nr:hypothetical protein CHS0354_042979 [Potamilus streckersoni]